MITSICVKGTIWCNNCDHIYLVPLRTLSRGCRRGQWCTRPSKERQDVTIISHCFITLYTLKHRSFHRFSCIYLLRNPPFRAQFNVQGQLIGVPLQRLVLLPIAR